ncbi:MAG: hypothetical protein LBQ38_10995 [Spirochaetaceae bacterium]|jgi:hypothetical protein|nr:hypothetical protein [Spirochaetaceae bacterium]
MPDNAELFLIMFRAEMESSLEDAEDLAAAYKKRFGRDEISSYVYNENEAFLAQEIAGLKGLIARLAVFSAKDFQTAEDMAAFIISGVHEKAELFENPEAVYRIVNRKVQKILVYIKMRQDE